MPTDLPPQFEQSTGKAEKPADLSAWWTQFQDPTLSTLVQRALDNNLDLKSARARLEEAEAQEVVTGASRLPGITGSATASSGGSSRRTQDSYSAGVTISWLADIFGTERRARDAAAEDTRAAAATLQATRVALVAQVGDAYVAWRGSDARLVIAKENLQTQRETLQFVSWRAQAGLAGQVELEQARTAVAQTEAQIPALEASKAEQANLLAVLLGVPPGTLKEVLAGPTTPTIPPAIAVGIPADVLRQRPDVEAAAHTFAASVARTSAAEAALYPSLTLSGTLGLEALSLPDVLNGATVSRSLLASLAAPIFDAGKLRAAVNVRTAQQEQALLSYQSTVLTALEEVENALLNLARTRERKEALTRAAESARTAATLAQAQYRAGTIDYQSVLETERTRLAAEDALASAQTTEFSNLITLYRALGGGWSTGAAHD